MGTKKVTKYGRIREHLLAGNTISSLEAINIFHSTRLSSVIHTLKHRDGWNIESRTEISPDGARYSRYWIAKEDLEQMHRADEHANN